MLLSHIIYQGAQVRIHFVIKCLQILDFEKMDVIFAERIISETADVIN